MGPSNNPNPNNSVNLSDDLLCEKFRRENAEQFLILVRMHLSFVLDLHTEENEYLMDKAKSKKWNLLLPPFVKKPKYNKSIMEGAPLTQEGICQAYQLIEFLKKEQNLKMEGIFRRTGSLERQQDLRNALSQGITLQLEGGLYSVHDCASVLKGFLAELPDPLLTEAHYPAYCQIAELCGVVEEPTQEAKLLEALQLILLLLPSENKVLLRDILDLLHLTSQYEDNNKMSPENLAKLFTPHLLCPRKLSPEILLSNSQTLFGIVAFMIRNAPDLFKVPQKLLVDFRARYDKSQQQNNLNDTIDTTANTVFTFVDQERTAKENEANPTETALAQLYAHIQSLPESSKKRKLVKQFNKENGHGTPLQVVRSSMPKNNKSFGDSIKKHLLHKGLVRSVKKAGLNPLRSSSEEILNETMMTPRSRKPVLLLSGTNINNLPKVDVRQMTMDSVCEETIDTNSIEMNRNQSPNQLVIKKSKSDGDIIPSTIELVKLNKTDPSTTTKTDCLTENFREYLSSRDILTLSSSPPAVDTSFSSRTDDFNSDLSDSKMTDSLLHCLDGNEPPVGGNSSLNINSCTTDDSGQGFEKESNSINSKELVLKPKQYDQDGKIIFETSF